LFSYLRTLVVPTAVFAATEDWASEGGALAERIDRAAGELADLLTRTVPQARETDEVVPFAQLLARRTT